MVTFNKIIGLYIFIDHVNRISSYELYSGDPCILLDGTPGVCKLHKECNWVKDQIKSKHLSPNDLITCGFEGFTTNDVVLCCKETLPKKTKSEEACEMYRQERVPPFIYQITNGERAVLGEFPQMAALGYTSKENKLIKFKCGGSLISDRYVLTAAHCTNKERPILVRLGTININNPETDLEGYGSALDVIVESVKQHPDYSYPSRYHDISLIRLVKKVIFDHFLHPACLNTKLYDQDLSTTKLIVAGWGREGFQGKESDFLLKTNLTIVNTDDCNITTTSYISRRFANGLASGQLCANDPQGLSDTCNGDSGGPILIFDNTTDNREMPVILGVTSFGMGCGSPAPGIYARVTFYLSWIESIVWPN